MQTHTHDKTVNGILNKVTDFEPIYCLPVKELLVGSFSRNRQDFLTSWQGVARSDKEGVNIRRGLFPDSSLLLTFSAFTCTQLKE